MDLKLILASLQYRRGSRITIGGADPLDGVTHPIFCQDFPKEPREIKEIWVLLGPQIFSLSIRYWNVIGPFVLVFEIF